MHVVLRIVFGVAATAVLANLAHRQYVWVKANADASAQEAAGKERTETLYRQYADQMNPENRRRFEEALRRAGAAA